MKSTERMQYLHVSVGDIVFLLFLFHVLIFIDVVVLREHTGLIGVVQLGCSQQKEVCIPLLQTYHTLVLNTSKNQT